MTFWLAFVMMARVAAAREPGATTADDVEAPAF